jgi:hypothetical protein
MASSRLSTGSAHKQSHEPVLAGGPFWLLHSAGVAATASSAVPSSDVSAKKPQKLANPARPLIFWSLKPILIDSPPVPSSINS